MLSPSRFTFRWSVLQMKQIIPSPLTSSCKAPFLGGKDSIIKRKDRNFKKEKDARGDQHRTGGCPPSSTPLSPSCCGCVFEAAALPWSLGPVERAVGRYSDHCHQRCTIRRRSHGRHRVGQERAAAGLKRHVGGEAVVSDHNIVLRQCSGPMDKRYHVTDVPDCSLWEAPLPTRHSAVCKHRSSTLELL